MTADHLDSPPPDARSDFEKVLVIPSADGKSAALEVFEADRWRTLAEAIGLAGVVNIAGLSKRQKHYMILRPTAGSLPESDVKEAARVASIYLASRFSDGVTGLVEIINAWHRLSPAFRSVAVAMIRAAAAENADPEREHMALEKLREIAASERFRRGGDAPE